MLLAPGMTVQIGKRTTIMLIADEKQQELANGKPEELANERKGRESKGEGESMPQKPQKKQMLSQKLRFDIKCLPALNYLVHAGVPFLTEITVFNEGSEPSTPVYMAGYFSGEKKSRGVGKP